MRIRTKLFLGFGALIFLMFALAGIGINRLSNIKENLNDVYTNRYTKVSLANGTRFQVNNMALYMANLVSADKNTNVVEEMRKLDLAQADAGNKFTELTRLSESNPEETKLVSAVNGAGAEFLRYENQLLELIRAGKYDEAQTLRNASGLNARDELAKRLEELSTYHETRMNQALSDMNTVNSQTLMITMVITGIGLLLGLGIMFWIIYSITGGLNLVSGMISSFAGGTMDRRKRIEIRLKDEIGEVAAAFQNVALDLMDKTEREQELNKARDEENWLNSNMAEVTTMLQGMTDLHQVAQTFIGEVTPMVGASFGALYVKEDEGKRAQLSLYGSYAFSDGARTKTFRLGEGLVGQSALDKDVIHLQELPPDYIKVGSGIGDAIPSNLIVHPVIYQGEVVAVLEVASFRRYSDQQVRLLEMLAGSLAIMIHSINGRNRVEELLRISQSQTEELQSQSEELMSQQEELRLSNEKLEAQTKSLKQSEELLQRQQGELEHSNEELLRQTQQLELQIWETEQINRQIERTKAALERQALQLALSSKYKSEFLANMSHELRTPLNSLLILSQLLADNKTKNLTAKQVEFAETIHASGSDLLKLIDEILDLSKVESGKMDIHLEHILLKDMLDYVRRSFQPIARKNHVAFEVKVDEELPDTIYTDSHRVQQILKNLLSNAFKFTKEGSVTLEIGLTETPEDLREQFPDSRRVIAFAVKDTGIGIPEDKLDLIFEAFQQADGTTSRQYGGTGLGLSISRELARLVGGTIGIESVVGEGSVFTLYLPETKADSVYRMLDEVAAAADAKDTAPEEQDLLETFVEEDVELESPSLLDKAALEPSGIEDDRASIRENDKVILVIEDDVNFAKIILDMARDRGFKGIVAMQGDQGLALAQAYKPDAIVLDIQLPVMDGWAILNHLKHNMETRHIPVHVMSVTEDTQKGLTRGAISYLTKPISREQLDQAFSGIEEFFNRDCKRLLLVEDDDTLRESLVELIGHDDLVITAVSTGEEALSELRENPFDCMVLDLGLSDISGFELLNTIRSDYQLRELPIIIYTGRELDSKEEMLLRKYAESIIIKNVKSPERLFDETALFLHRVESNLPEDKREILEKLHSKEAVFSGKRILLVDDDIRNVFALSSILENYNMDITFAENGREALQLIEKEEPFDLILMDIMMPVMDGYEAMRAIRSMPDLERLPIIALTAKAMKEDRNKCIEAGASDYITKPINTDQLLSLLKVWLYK
ncbi:response regulator [Paenibacillus aurantius]|uniref:Circadian input-output histidine kinase CikA n=1 Tax=Paenibacillus aurantius TaxID=2918900 RepID=A0AA96RET8_9BACL|nr:response regulator [Paenibacillus aurantius]WNQ10543.1 response regulator [Paenibacillus aurantius]